MTDSTRPCAGVAWYSRDQWQRLRDVSDDRADLEASWEEWNTHAEQRLADMRCSSTTILKVPVDVDAMVNWCRERDLPVNAASRSEYTAELIQLMLRRS